MPHAVSSGFSHSDLLILPICSAPGRLSGVRIGHNVCELMSFAHAMVTEQDTPTVGI
jgi:hypothetical protein